MIETDRILLRRWKNEDAEPFARLCADPRVMEFFPALNTREECDAGIARAQSSIETRGFGMWAAELKEGARFMGFIGLAVPRFEAHFTPCVEIGWRLAHEFWGKGIATEGALAVLRYGFEVLALPEIVAMTATENRRSRRVMEKLHMSYDPSDDFDHPGVPEPNPLRRHVLYRKRTRR